MRAEPLWSSEDYEKHIGAHAGYAAKQRLAGNGPAYIKIGRKVAYDPRDVQAWLDARKMCSTSEAQTA
jgi:orotidine-5'-phosphate decarboxylase